MTSPGRIRDLADVQELIRHLDLGREIADKVDLSVRDRFLEHRAGFTICTAHGSALFV